MHWTQTAAEGKEDWNDKEQDWDENRGTVCSWERVWHSLDTGCHVPVVAVVVLFSAVDSVEIFHTQLLVFGSVISPEI